MGNFCCFFNGTRTKLFLVFPLQSFVSNIYFFERAKVLFVGIGSGFNRNGFGGLETKEVVFREWKVQFLFYNYYFLLRFVAIITLLK